RFFGHALEIGDIRERQRIEVSDVTHESALNKLSHQHFAAAFDIHSAAGAPVFEPSPDLRRAVGIDATPGNAFVSFSAAGGASHFRAALGTGLRESEGNLFAGAPG